MNLKNLKKVHEDDHVALFRNKDGHEVRVSKGGLSEKLKKQLSSLPLHAASGGKIMSSSAEGEGESRFDKALEDWEKVPKQSTKELAGEGKTAAIQATSDMIANAIVGDSKSWKRAGQKEEAPQEESPQEYSETLPAAEMSTQQEAPTQSAGIAPQESFDQMPAEEAAPQEAPPQEPRARMPAQSQPPMQDPMVEQAAAERQKAYNQYNLDHATSHGIERAKFNQDLYNGHIQPKTYRDLFSKNSDGSSKSTIGKIGTLFGLMVSGAGAGLSHQPNAVLEMMNKEIDNDLKAQVESKTNAQNFYRLNMQRELNQGQLRKMVQEGVVNEAQAQNLIADAHLKAIDATKSQLELISLYELQGQVNALPPGQDRDRWQGTLNGMKNAAELQAQQRNIQTARSLRQNQEGYLAQTDKMHKMGILNPRWETMARNREERTIPNLGVADRPVPEKDRDVIAAKSNFLHKVKELRQWARQHSGSLDPRVIQEGEVKAKILQDAYRQANDGGVFKQSESEFINGIIDEKPTKFFNRFRVDPKFKALETGVNTDLDAVKDKYHISPFSDTKAPEQQQETQQDRKFYKGKWYVRGADGKAVEVK